MLAALQQNKKVSRVLKSRDWEMVDDGVIGLKGQGHGPDVVVGCLKRRVCSCGSYRRAGSSGLESLSRCRTNDEGGAHLGDDPGHSPPVVSSFVVGL